MSRMKKTAEKPVKESVAEPVVETAAAAKPAPKKPAPRKPAAPKECVHVQFSGSDWIVADLIEQAKAAYAAENTEAVKEIELYVKPEENKAYYVINGGVSGSIDLADTAEQ